MENISNISTFFIGCVFVALIVIIFVIYTNSKKIQKTTPEPIIEINNEEIDEQTKIQADKKAKEIIIKRLAKKVKRKITKGLFTEKSTTAKNKSGYDTKSRTDIIDISEVKSILGEKNNNNKIQSQQINHSLAATQEFDQNELMKAIKK